MDEILTGETPDTILRDALAGVPGSLVVGGHTHRQLLRVVTDRLTYANAGSVGLPYEGRTGAFWLTVNDGVVHFRESHYDLSAAIGELVRSGLADARSLFEMSLLQPVDPRWMAAMLERRAGR